MKLWRIIKESNLENAFSGEGAKAFGGRWNHEGTTVVYCSDSLALAEMELFIHVQRPDKFRPLKSIKLFSIEIRVPLSVSIEEVKYDTIPEAWKEMPAADETKNIGSDWAHECRSLLLKVPALVVPSGDNYLINPLHKEFKKLKFSKPKEFIFDKRLWRAVG
jgi:RES domain-containing protein